MAVPEPSDASVPIWRRGEAAIPWTPEDSEPAETMEREDSRELAEQTAPREPAAAALTGHQSRQQRTADGRGTLPQPRGSGRQQDDPGIPPLPAEAPNGELPQSGERDLEGERPPRQLHPLPRGLVELYGLLAVLFVLVPEWMASGALFGFREGRRGSELPAPSGAWKRLPELRLASLNLAELRELAREQRLLSYGRLNRTQLTSRLLRRLKARP